jgi:hypothetical protein
MILFTTEAQGTQSYLIFCDTSSAIKIVAVNA